MCVFVRASNVPSRPRAASIPPARYRPWSLCSRRSGSPPRGRPSRPNSAVGWSLWGACQTRGSGTCTGEEWEVVLSIIFTEQSYSSHQSALNEPLDPFITLRAALITVDDHDQTAGAHSTTPWPSITDIQYFPWKELKGMCGWELQAETEFLIFSSANRKVPTMSSEAGT